MRKILLILTTFLSMGLSAQTTLVINELMQSNVETIMDDIKEFPDSWVELYNPTDAAINLKDYKIGTKKKADKAWKLPDMEVPAGGHVIIYCDKEGLEDNRLHTNFRLESGDDGNLYLFMGSDMVDKLVGMAMMPSPDVAYGRETDGGETWGYELTPTPGAQNEGGVVDADHILGAPVFTIPGKICESGKRIKLSIKAPEGSPEGTEIHYTTDGSEPTIASPVYKTAMIENTTVIRAKAFCEGYISPVSTAQSYIFHPREMTLPIFSVLTDDRYLNDTEIGLFANNHSKEDKKLHDWRRPVNIEFFNAPGTESIFNQLSETRIQGGQSRGNALRSMVFYANKRFDPEHKRFSYEFFPDQKPGVTEFKSFSLRDGGNDFGDLYFRDLIIQRTMGSHTDLDWQAGHSAVLYINGEYMGMLNIRERSNEDNIYSNYNGLEDLDIVEIGHEQDQNSNNLFIEELKEGTSDFYEAFKAFYSEKGHTLAEYEEWIDVSEYLNVMVLNLFYGNIDFPGNNLVFWRPNDDDTESGLPKIWRVIVKDTDFGLGLYSRKSDYNTIDLIFNPNAHSGDNWACTEPATRLFKNMMENEEIRAMFIDKCCVFMGDFMNAKGTGEIIDLIKAEALEEFVAHRDKYNAGGGWWGQPDNRSDILNKFEDAKKWLAGYTEQGWWGQSTTYLPRTDYFCQHIAQQWNLSTPVALTVNTSKKDVVITINGIGLSENTFDGKFFANRKLTITGTAPEGKVVTGWRLTGARNEEVAGSVLSINMTSSKLNIEPVIGEVGGANGIQAVEQGMQRTENWYTLDGRKLDSMPTAKGIYIQNGKKVVIK